jgi:hypothetical protein
VSLTTTQGKHPSKIAIPVDYLHGHVNETVFVTHFGVGENRNYAAVCALVLLLLVRQDKQ